MTLLRSGMGTSVDGAPVDGFLVDLIAIPKLRADLERAWISEDRPEACLPSSRMIQPAESEGANAGGVAGEIRGPVFEAAGPRKETTLSACAPSNSVDDLEDPRIVATAGGAERT